MITKHACYLFITISLFLFVHCEDVEDDEHTPYLGRSLGRFNAFSHQIDGELFVINMTSFFLRNFFYDGSGKDTYFWVGSSNHADRRAGYPVPDEQNRTNVLKRYINDEITLTLPPKKKISDLKWFAIHDVASITTFAEVVFPEDFEPPGPHLLPELTRNAHGVKSNPIKALDSKTLQITDFSYDGLGPDTYFWVGNDPVPSSKGMKIPDENGYLESLRPYQKANITLTLPGNMTIFDIDWLSVFNIATRENYGSVLFPRELNVPPSLTKSILFESELINCEQLHEKMQISWQINKQFTAITFEVAGQMGNNDYMAFGVNERDSRMIGSRVMVLFTNGSKSFVEDYFISEVSSCLAVPKDTGTEITGVCPARMFGLKGIPIQTHKLRQIEGVTIINFTLPIKQDSLLDPETIQKEVNFIWAMGHLNHKLEPTYHYLRNTGSVKLNFDRQPSAKRCFLFTKATEEKKSTWGPLFIADPKLTVFNVSLGPPAGSRGYEGITGLPPSNLVWYVNGLMAPELYVKRGQRYTFVIEGGNDVQNPAYHHPFYITDDSRGGFETFSPREKWNVNFYAGVSVDHKGRPIPIAAGRLCIWENQKLNPRNWDEFPTFYHLRATLKQRCEPGKPFVLEWTPNGTIPNVVYYQSFRKPYMGWKIHIVDVVRRSSASSLSTSLLFVIFTSVVCIINLMKK